MTGVIITQHQDCSDAEFGRGWSVKSPPLSGPLNMRTELQGIIGERPDAPTPDRAFWWEAWHDVAVMGDELCEEGYAPTFDAATAAIQAVWARSPLAEAEPYVPSRRSTFSERMAGS